MSRCFPFPPPGYVRKSGVESAGNVDLLKQDKHKENKDKKEKKDREKRESKERKEKDRVNDKHRDKKEKKDKHRDKKKDKDKDKEKETEWDHSSSSNDMKLPLQTGGINEETGFKERGSLPSLLPVGKPGDRSIHKEKVRDKLRNNTPDGKRPAGQNVEKIIFSNNSLRDTSDNNKYVQELEKRVRNDRSSGTQLAEKFIVAEKKKDDVVVQSSAKPSAGVRLKGKEWNKERRENEEKIERVNGNLKVQSFGGALQGRAPEVTIPLEQNNVREKFKGREGEEKLADKSKEKDRKKKGQGNVIVGRERDEERMGENSERTGHSDQERLKLSRKNDLLSSPNTKRLQQPVKEPDKTRVAIGNVIKKRKEPQTNGFLHANDMRASKMPKQILASHPPLENGRMPEPYTTPPAQVAPPGSGPANSSNIMKANKDDRKINGVTGTRPMPPVSSPLNIQSSKPPVSSPVNIQSSSSQANALFAEVSLVRPPHPDSKHLDEILSRVPRMEELPELDDDQGWLFDTDRWDSKKSKRGHALVDEMPQVWGESLHVESADIYALPYVIPY